MRIVKDFNDRRREFLDLTKKLFLSVGYEKVTIQMLTDQIGVAKGTFYHYFTSKEDLLVQWIRDEIDQAMPMFEEIVKSEGLNAIQKMNTFFERGVAWKIEKIDMIVLLMKVMYGDENIRLRTEMTRQSVLQVGSIYGRVIEQGIGEGLFNTRFPDDIASVVLRMSQMFSEDLSLFLLDHYESRNSSIEDALKLTTIWQDAIERILGADEGTLHLANRNMLEAFFEYITNNQ